MKSCRENSGSERNSAAEIQVESSILTRLDQVAARRDRRAAGGGRGACGSDSGQDGPGIVSV